MTLLTALERELLGYVERLATASEAPGQVLRDLEARSTSRMGQRMDGLADCVLLLIQSQTASMTALRGLLNDDSTYATLDRELTLSLAKAKAAETRLKRR